MAAPARHLLAWLRAPINSASFAVRRRVRWNRGEPLLPFENADDLFGYLSGGRRRGAERRAEELRSRYGLDELWSRCTRLVLCDNLCVLEGLERLAGDSALPGSEPVRVLDVGSGDFRYATALKRFFVCRSDRAVDLTGVEVDGHWIYRDGHSRADYGRAHAEKAGAEYAIADFCSWPDEPVHAVTMLFPFLTRYALLQWGLPPLMFRPRGLLRRAADLLMPGGWLMAFHQSAREQAVLRALVCDLPLRMVREVPLATDLVPYHEATADRKGSLLVRV